MDRQTTLVKRRPTTEALRPGSSRRWGSISAWWAAGTSVAFTVSAVVGAFAWPQPTWTGDIAAYAHDFQAAALVSGTVLSILIIPGFVGFAVVAHLLTPVDRHRFTLAALVLTAAYAATVGANDFLQITTVRLNFQAGTTDGLSLLVADNPLSVFYPLEALGYFWQTMAGLLLVFVFRGSRLSLWVRWGLSASFVSGVMGVVATILGLGFSHPFFIVGAALWAVGFPLAMVAAALLFSRLPEAER
jgi:hypothetical protein